MNSYKNILKGIIWIMNQWAEVICKKVYKHFTMNFELIQFIAKFVHEYAKKTVCIACKGRVWGIDYPQFLQLAKS